MDNNVGASYLIMALGIVAALASLQSLPDVRKKQRVFQIIFFLGITTQIATQIFQYSKAVVSHKARDRQFAYALFVYTYNDTTRLKDFANETPYLIGYRLFNQKFTDLDQAKCFPDLDQAKRFPDLNQAKRYFKRSIQKGQYVAPSYYMLGTVERMQNPPNLTTAKQYFDQAIDNDPKYAAPYYGRALTEVDSDPSNALKDLATALDYEEGDVICWSISTDNQLWKNITPNESLNRRFTELKRQCSTPTNSGLP